MLQFSFAGFLRFNELANKKVKNISIKDLYINICVETSKTDVYRRGNKITIAKTEGMLNSKDWREAIIYLELPFYKSSQKYMLCKINKPIPNKRARELLMETLEKVGKDSTRMGYIVQETEVLRLQLRKMCRSVLLKYTVGGKLIIPRTIISKIQLIIN